MRNKKAKALRKLARATTPGLPDVEYLEKSHKHLDRKTRVLASHCTRKVYQLMKRGETV